MDNKKITELTELSEAPAAGDLFEVVDVSDTTMSSDGTNKKITSTNLLAGVPSSPFALKGTATVTGSAANILTVSSLDLDTDKVYKVVCYINAAAGGDPIVGWQVNSDTTATNYRYVRVNSDGSSLTTARVSTNNWGANIMAGKTLVYEYMISKKSSTEVWGETGMIPYGTLGSMNFRQYGIAWIGTANVTSLSIIDSSGSSFLDVGTIMKVYTLGF